LVKQWEVGKPGQPSLPEKEEVWGIGEHLKAKKKKAYMLQLDPIPQGAQET